MSRPDGHIPYVRATGSPFALGVRHGEHRAKALRTFLNDDLARLNRVMRNATGRAELAPRLALHHVAIEAVVPELMEEIRGLAHGAAIGLEEALLLQLRREIMGYRKVPTLGDCTTYARSGPNHAGPPVLAQTVDLNGDLDDQICVLDVSRAGSGRRSLVLSFAGLLGYLGMNSDGLAVGLNLVLGGEWRPGLPPYLAIRHLLDTAADVDEAVSTLRELLPTLASSRSLTLCDAKSTAYVEILGEKMRVVMAEQTVHTNHFLHPDFAPHDELNVFARRSSLRRFDAAQERLRTLAPEADAEEHFTLLSAAPIRVPDRGDIRTERTVAAVVMLPTRGELHLRPGDPALSASQVFRLREESQHARIF